MTELPQIGCTLTPGAYADRMSWIAKLNRDFLRSHRRLEGTLELTYAPAAASQVRLLIEREQECCAFLRFELREHEDSLEVRIEAPSNVGEGAALLFEPFLEGLPIVDPGGAPVTSARGNRIPGVAAVTSATAAVACGVCCVLPFAFPALALTAVGGVFAAFARVYWWALVAAIAAVGAGWSWIGWQSLSTRRRPARSTLRAMSGATVLLFTALSWPLLEPHIIGFFKS